MTDPKAQNIYKTIRRSVRALAGDSDNRNYDSTRLDLLQLVVKYPGIAFSVYKVYPEEYKAALESCKLLFEPRIFDPEQQFFNWDDQAARQAEADSE